MFKPLLCPNQKVDLNQLQYPLLASTKIDGIRAIFKDGEMYSRSLKQLPNKQLAARFECLKKYSKEHNIILDGELWAKSVTFPELSGIIRQLDCSLPDDLKFYCFDMVTNENFDEIFDKRVDNLIESFLSFNTSLAYVEVLEQIEVESPTEVDELFQHNIKQGYEGLILRNKLGRYKQGRCTIKENIAYKCKPFETFDSKIIGIIQATEVNSDVEKKTNELGRSITSKRIGDRHVIDKASAFVVKYNGLDLKVTLSMSDKEKEDVWKNQDKYLGRIIEYRGMLVGAKLVPRHATFIRFRSDRDE